MSSRGLTSTSLTPNLGFNWVFLVELLVCGIVTLFFLFYFNRVFATLISYGIRAWTWHKYRVYIDIQAIQISLLGGRIFFKGIRYHGNNETILIHSGFVTWTYWLRDVRELDIDGSQKTKTKKESAESDNDETEQSGTHAAGGIEEGGIKDTPKLPCRFNILLTGAEWFVYNRSVAYDAVVAGMTNGMHVDSGKNEPPDSADSETKTKVNGLYESEKVVSSSKGSSQDSVPSEQQSPLTEKTTYGTQPVDHYSQKSAAGSQGEVGFEEESRTSPDSSFILRFLPVHIEIVKAALVLGNENTKSVLITKVDKASGEIDATRCTTLDQYRQLLNFNFEHPVVQMKPNDDFKEDQNTAASRIKRGTDLQPNADESHVHTHSFFHRQRRRVYHTLQDLVPYFRSSVESFSSSSSCEMPSTNGRVNTGWQGLSRYLDESEQDDSAKWSSVEYATVSTIVDSPSASMSFYWDVVGTVPGPSKRAETKEYENNINGDQPPEWGLNMLLKGAIVNYGPWADRQRADLQRVFFPSLCKDSSPAKPLMTGQFRTPTEFKIYIEFDEETVLRVPIREESKNWKWAKQADRMGTHPKVPKRNGIKNRKNKANKGNPTPEFRPFGWLDVRVGTNATVSYTMDMIPGPAGYSNKLDLDLPNIEITTSVNHGLLWRSVANQLTCDLSNPLEWNALRSWKFNIVSEGLELFILREHVFLLIDLIGDWGSGPPPDYLTFTPFQYLVNLDLRDFRLYLNVNDSNIINNPSDMDDNTFIIIYGAALTTDVRIPLINYRPHRNDVSFKVDANTGGLNLHVPPWNTQATFLTSTEFAQLKTLAIDGTYQYCSTTSAANTDTLLLNVHGHAPTCHFYGFIIRYFLKVKDNYFGEDIHFKTLEEHQELLRNKDNDTFEATNSQPHKKSNDLDVILSVTADESSVILPARLYSAQIHTRIEIATIAADLRFTNYYMDLEVALSTLAFSQGNEDDGTATPLSATSSTQVFVDGVNATGNRLFGLPPTEPTYMCNWDFAIGAVTGECTSEFLSRLAKGASGFAFSFDDDENALPSVTQIVLHDVTFLRMSLESIHIWLHVDEAAFLLSTGCMSLLFNDWAGSRYSQRLDLKLPDIRFGCVDAESASRHRSRTHQRVETHALIETTLSFSIIQRKLEFAKDRQKQQDHIRRHDQRTHRADFLLHSTLSNEAISDIIDPPAMCFPPIPLPVVDVEDLSEDCKSFTSSSLRNRTRFVKRKRSFLSFSSTSQRSDKSVLRHKASPHFDNTSTSISRSRSLQAIAGHGATTRDISASTGRQSSFYSAVGEHRGLPPTTVTFSSSYIAPYFPLESVEPDSRDLPLLSEGLKAEYGKMPTSLTLEDIQPDRVSDDAKHTSFIIELPLGLTAFCRPKAVDAVAGLLAAMQAIHPADILDSLQVDSMKEIFDLAAQKVMTSKVVDLKLRTPEVKVRFLNSSESEFKQQVDREKHDQYDLSICGLNITSRSETAVKKKDKSQVAKESSALHISLASASLSAKERFGDLDDPQAAVHIGIEDVILWAASSENRSANVSIKVIEATTVSRKVEYLASLVHRTNVVATNMSDTFSALASQQRNRVQLFTYCVATAGQEANDPLFLIRPSYVLRSASEHLRTTDSWKIVTRLRHMYSSLGASEQQDIVLRCLNNSEILPQDAQHRVLSVFSQWRSWDLHDLNACLVMSKVYGSWTNLSMKETPTSQTTRVSFRTELIKLVLDPGPKQNAISLGAITAIVEDKMAVSDVESDLHTHPTLQHFTVVQTYCADASINLNWELCELAKDILALFQQGDSVGLATKASLPINPTNTSDIHPPRRQIHVIVATGKGSITLDTINIRAESISEGLKASFVYTKEAKETPQTIVNVMLSAKTAKSKIRSYSQELTFSQLRFPSVFASLESDRLGDSTRNIFKVAASSQELSYVVRQDTLVLIEIFDLLLGDEVAQLNSLRKSFPSSSLPHPGSAPSTSSAQVERTINKINVALFLDMYHISLPLLPSLTYNISGVVARTTVSAQLGSDIIFDFDVKEHSHDIQTMSSQKPRSISLLQMPPTNGRITSHMTDEEISVSVFISVEPVDMDAAAIHSLLTALNRPEISSVINDIRDDVKGVSTHFEEIFGPSQKSSPSPVESRPIIYDAHLTFAGLDIFATAPGLQNSERSARIDFNLGSVQVQACNRLEQRGPVLTLPELRIGLRQIVLELSRWDEKGMEVCGNVAFGAFLTATSKLTSSGEEVRSFHLKSDQLEINLFAETASCAVDILGHLQNKIKDLDLSREKKYLRKLRQPKPRISIRDDVSEQAKSISGSTTLFASMYSLELLNIQISWFVADQTIDHALDHEMENLVLSVKRIDLSTRKENSARLTIEDFQLQMVPESQNKMSRSLNSALLPEVIFNVGYVSTTDARRLAFQAAGKSLDLRLTSQFIRPAVELKRSIGSSVSKVRAATAMWNTQATHSTVESTTNEPFFGKKRMESLLVDADFAGAVVYIAGKGAPENSTQRAGHSSVHHSGRYGQFTGTDAGSNTVLRAPGLAWKVEYKDSGLNEPSLNAEVKVDASSNILYPAVVPLILEMSSTVKEVVSDGDDGKEPLQPKVSPQKFMSGDEDNILTADPSTVLGRTRLNLGLRICRQEFSLSCQPIARVAATAKFDDIYLTVNTVRSSEHGHFFAASAAFSRLQASVQHVYSRESTGSFEVETIFLSLMNSKHLSGTSGISAILKISPMKALVNAKQLQDFLLFREIWVPPEIRQSAPTPMPDTSAQQSQTYLVQRYQEVAATGAFPWNATVSIEELDVQLDLGQAIGRSSFMITEFWISSKKTSDWEQNLCLGFKEVGVESAGRMSGFVTLQDFKMRTSIQWPAREKALNQTPLVQGSVSFSQFRVKAAFDYQAFLVADITSLKFLMYNVRSDPNAKGDRLVAVLDGEAVQVFCTTTSASQALALYQAFQRLVQEKRTNYETSLTEIEKFMRRKSVAAPTTSGPKNQAEGETVDKTPKSPISLHTDVIVTLKALNIGAFPNTFHDHQVFKLEALDAQARFAVNMNAGRIHSILGLTLGQLRIALSGVRRVELPKSVGETSVEDVVASATGSRGGTILKVPKVEAMMQTWQTPNSNHIDYIFKSYFEGKVEVGWNYSRISYIRSMWATHSKALAQRLGKPLPPSAVKITGVPDEENKDRKDGEQQKITAEVNVPQSKYDYTALEPPIIETPQLRDMGEATPPLEWIGLHRDRLPNLTHQIVIVTLLEVASEVEDAYAKILGSS
ncbi:hypothetical protein BP5796_01559 [Coleophoma crateriformis]|uniref:Fermentation associated protein n=1 Tax=Coleophoma crateriformis TaxID=565419 RepID=A0A3D8T0R6_9HELO|nr:hypothetical protein BP5796_01559 [Coleophoma crateriformis]